MRKVLGLLVALPVVFAACTGADTSSEETEPAVVTEQEAESDAGDEPGEYVTAMLDAYNLEPTGGILDCLQGLGIDIATPLTPEPLVVAAMDYGSYACVPEDRAAAEISQFVAEGGNLGPGVEEHDATCVLAERYRLLGGLTFQEATLVLQDASAQTAFKTQLAPIVVAACDLGTEQVLLMLGG